MKKSRSKPGEMTPLKTEEQQARCENNNRPHTIIIANYSTRKRVRTINSLSSMIGLVIISIACLSSAVVSAQNVANQHDLTNRKKLINNNRVAKKKRELSGTWNWNEKGEVNSKSLKSMKKSKSDKGDSSPSWSSGWTPPTSWSSPQKPASGQPTPWMAVGHLPTTSRPTTSSIISAEPTSKMSPKPTAEVPAEPQSSPTYAPTQADPTYAPTITSSTTPSAIPSSNPSSEPSLFPSHPPSSEPSPMPSSYPSASPSSKPAVSSKPTPFYFPSDSPTVSAAPTSSPSTNPPEPTLSPAATDSPTISPKPTTSQRTARPTWAPTISNEPSWAERTKRPTFSPTISNEPTPADRTMKPTLSPTTGSPPTISPQAISSDPTSSFVTDSRSELRMGLFGLEFMNEDQISWFQNRTALYMDSFYNGTDSTSLLDLIKRQVTDMTVVINVVKQEEPPDLLGDIRGRSLRASRVEGRALQLSVTDPCEGDPLTVTFSMELQYRTSDPTLAQSDRVISFPFRTIPFREEYIEAYLKADDGGAFDDLYCTSQIIFPTENQTGVPTSTPTVLSTNNGTVSPTIAPSKGDSLAPTLSKKPTTLAPTSNTTSLSPTTTNITSLSPTTSKPPSTDTSSPSTTTQEPRPVVGLRMDMYGLTQQLDSLGVQLYNERTANYIESFYNDNNSTDGIRGQVLDVTATINVTEQIIPEEESGTGDNLDLDLRRPRHGKGEHDVVDEDGDDEFYLPEHAIVNSDNFVNARYRYDDNVGRKQQQGKRLLQIIDDCTGERLELVFTASLSYRLTNSSITEADIINEPFSTFLRRRNYMDDYLKGLDVGPFVNLTCTGEVIFPSGGSPTVSPTNEQPTQQPSVPAISNMTIQPTVSGNETTTDVPTLSSQSNETTVPTPSSQPNETPVPTLSSQSNETVVPTIASMTTVPTPSSQSNETIVPTLSSQSNETIVPTVSNVTTVPTTGGITVVRSDIEMDLFGLMSLDPISTDVYNIQTAEYISSFYDGDVAVSISTILVAVTDENIPIGPTDGPDCSEIDPFTVTFTIDMTYSTSDPAITFDDIISLPFSTTQLQDRYIDLLKSNDVNGGFANLQCISELRIPSSPTTASPTGTSVPSASPMTMVDDLLNDLDLKRSNLLPEIDCHVMVDPQLLDRSQEIEISFLYGVQSKTVDHFYLEELEGLILDFLRVSIVMCLDDGEQAAPQVWKIDDQQDAAGVIRVRYPEFEDPSTICKFHPLSFGFAFILHPTDRCIFVSKQQPNVIQRWLVQRDASC